MKHIAVVEDEALMREELADMLRRADYAVTEITDFSAVTGQLLALAPDLVLLDLNLPGADGMTVLQTLRQTDRDTRVLILSARSEVSDKVAGLYA